MRPADTWVDYELIDATNHNRLERWGKTLLIRPDPQIIWKNEEVSPLWARADAIYYRSAKGGGQWDYHKKLPQKWNIKWQDLTLIVSPTGFKHTGVFPEQAVNWAWYQEKIKAADRPGKVLNLFGYTGGATLACRAAGASVTHVDASKGMVAWARENAQASSLADRSCRALRGGKRHYRGGRAHQPHRQKALAAGPAGGRQRLCLRPGRSPGRSRCRAAGRERRSAGY